MQVLDVVRVVRNNLLHGGKFPIPVGPIEDPSRNALLLRHCCTVLEKYLEIAGSCRDKRLRSVRRAFDEELV